MKVEEEGFAEVVPVPALTLSALASTTSLNLNEYHELLALLRAVMEAKFSGHGPDTEIVASPLLANVANRLVETLMAMEKSRGNYSASRWQTWRRLDSSRREWQLIIKRIRAVAQWNDWTTMERSKFLDYLASPLALTEESREALLRTQ